MNAILLVLGAVGFVISAFYFLVAGSDPEGRGGSIMTFAFFGGLASVALASYALYEIIF